MDKGWLIRIFIIYKGRRFLTCASDYFLFLFGRFWRTTDYSHTQKKGYGN